MGQRKLAVSAVVLLAMALIHRVFLAMWAGVSTGGVVEVGSMLWVFTKLAVMSAVLFGVVAYREAEWTSQNAAGTAAVAWVALVAGYLVTSGCPCVLMATIVPCVPFLMGAALGHEIGRARHAHAGH
jgi:hypothetical protein